MQTSPQASTLTPGLDAAGAGDYLTGAAMRIDAALAEAGPGAHIGQLAVVWSITAPDARERIEWFTAGPPPRGRTAAIVALLRRVIDAALAAR